MVMLCRTILLDADFCMVTHGLDSIGDFRHPVPCVGTYDGSYADTRHCENPTSRYAHVTSLSADAQSSHLTYLSVRPTCRTYSDTSGLA